jgi:catechol 2,3-dioxygenase-like lactoylglutathione lyase family enzyme
MQAECNRRSTRVAKASNVRHAEDTTTISQDKEMPIRAIEHVQLAMPPGGEPKAREFYSHLLGIPEIEKPNQLAQRGGCWFEDGDLKIHLGVDSDFRPSRKAHPGLLVDQLGSLVSNLSRAGYQVREDDAMPGYHRAYVDDPFGNRVELMEPAPR